MYFKTLFFKNAHTIIKCAILAYRFKKSEKNNELYICTFTKLMCKYIQFYGKNVLNFFREVIIK